MSQLVFLRRDKRAHVGRLAAWLLLAHALVALVAAAPLALSTSDGPLGVNCSRPAASNPLDNGAPADAASHHDLCCIAHSAALASVAPRPQPVLLPPEPAKGIAPAQYYDFGAIMPAPELAPLAARAPPAAA